MLRIFGWPAIVAVMTMGFLSVSAAAQTQQAHEGVGVGIKGGYLHNSLRFDEARDLFDSQGGWMAGIFFGGNRPGTFGVMGELNILKKSALCGCNDEQNDLYYLQIPVLLRINAGSRNLSGVNVYGIVGPAADIKIGETLNSNIIDDYEGFDVSVVAGAGVEITRFIIEARATWGLRNIAKGLGENRKITSRTFAVLAGFRFN